MDFMVDGKENINDNKHYYFDVVHISFNWGNCANFPPWIINGNSRFEAFVHALEGKQ